MPESHHPLVDFLVVGAQKCGTSALRHFLSQHPEIGMPASPITEPHFFDREIEKARRGDYQPYHNLYGSDALQKVTGDVTPIYLFDPACLPLAKKYNPDLKIIVLLRDPAQRAYSQWVMQRDKMIEKRSFTGALLQELLAYKRYSAHPYSSYVQRGFYAKQLARLFRDFPPEQCLILPTTDLRDRHAQTLETIYRFLGVKPGSPPKAESIHSREYAKLHWLGSACLRSIFSRDMARLEKLIGWRPKPEL